MNIPSINDDKVIHESAMEILPKFMRWVGIYPTDENMLLSDIKKAIANNNDGYDIAKELDSMGYDSDTELVNIMEDMASIKYDCLKRIKTKWLSDNNITPKHAVGDVVSYKGNIAEIVRITCDGKYGLFIEALGHVKKGVGTNCLFVNWDAIDSHDY